jgi:uncharacterized BrkB/YihY/UPF0761 family membrane protein
MPDLGPLIQRVDTFQRTHRIVAFPFGVVKKFGDDRAGALGAQLTYYGFLSIFPLLLVLTTILGFIGNRDISDSVIGTALAQFPVFGEQIGKDVAHPISGSGLGLVVGLLVLLYGALGSTQAAQHAMAQVWNIPAVDRPGFFPRLVRGLTLFAALGLGITVSAVISGVMTANSSWFAARAAGIVVLVALNVGLYLAGFRALTPKVVATNELVPGAVLGGIAYTALLTLGTALLQHQLKHAEAVYGQFGFVLGLIGYLALVAQISLYAAELNVVNARRLWPRGIQPPLTDADRRVLRALVRQEQRSDQEVVDVVFEQHPTG